MHWNIFVIDFSPLDPPFLSRLSPLLLFCPCQDTLFQLPAPRNLKVHLYNAQQALSWEPMSLNNDTRPVVYQVQYK